MHGHGGLPRGLWIASVLIEALLDAGTSAAVTEDEVRDQTDPALLAP